MILLFHFLFKIIGSLVSASGFEDVIYQAELCSSKSLQGVLVGSLYNRAWAVHTALSEALERMLLTRSLAEKKTNYQKHWMTLLVTRLQIVLITVCLKA